MHLFSNWNYCYLSPSVLLLPWGGSHNKKTKQKNPKNPPQKKKKKKKKTQKTPPKKKKKKKKKLPHWKNDCSESNVNKYKRVKQYTVK